MNFHKASVLLIGVVLIGATLFTTTTLAASHPSVEFNDQTAIDAVQIAAANLPDGGFIAVYTSINGAPGEVIGHSAYLSPGAQEDIRITIEPIEENQTLFAVVHRDTNGDETFGFNQSSYGEDSPYTQNNQSVKDSARVYWPGTQTVVVQTVSPAVTTVTELVEKTRVAEKTRTVVQEKTIIVEKTTGQSGFGIAVTLLAILTLGLLAFRRRD